jgi:hypothetical protein
MKSHKGEESHAADSGQSHRRKTVGKLACKSNYITSAKRRRTTPKYYNPAYLEKAQGNGKGGQTASRKGSVKDNRKPTFPA